jgi:hypothetical protein
MEAAGETSDLRVSGKVTAVNFVLQMTLQQ